MKAIILAALVLAAAAPAAAVNVVTNGDFSAGNTGFTSDYSYRAPGNYGSALSEGLYAIDTSALNTHPAWVNLPDHTGDSAGLYLIANGAGEPLTLWQQSVSVMPNTVYTFSAWVADVCCAVPGIAAGLAGTAPPAFIFSVIDGQLETTIGTYVPSTFGVWENVGGSFSNGSATSLTLRIVNTNTVPGGNDLGIDDISFASAAVPEPASWAMLIAGFGLVGAVKRRRSRSVLA